MTADGLYAGTVADGQEADSLLLPGHDVPLGRYTVVRRLLPHRQRRMVGAWCFVDHFGPDDVTGRPGMQVPPHPHTGLQTVTWLVDGVVEHRDSLGSHQLVTPGQLNLMTAGHGIAHSEYTPPDHPALMHGLQLWVALPELQRHSEARFEHHAELPRLPLGDAEATVVVGRLGDAVSPARVHTPLLGAELRFGGPGRLELPAEPGFEHGLLAMTGAATVGGVEVTPGSLLHLGTGRDTLTIETDGEARLFLLGGTPFEEPLVMWWNFVARSHEEVYRARADWSKGRRFGTVAGCDADPLPAPALPTVRLKARDRHGTVPPGRPGEAPRPPRR